MMQVRKGKMYKRVLFLEERRIRCWLLDAGCDVTTKVTLRSGPEGGVSKGDVVNKFNNFFSIAGLPFESLRMTVQEFLILLQITLQVHLFEQGLGLHKAFGAVHSIYSFFFSVRIAEEFSNFKIGAR